MPDVVDSATRSKMMAGIKARNTRPEMVVRKGLHKLGYRFRLHDPKLPGKPDLVFSGRNAVIMVNGCFWHGHTCHLFRWPSTRIDFWRRKISRTRDRDAENLEALLNHGWRVLVIWECAIKGRSRKPTDIVIRTAAEWLQSGTEYREITGD